MDRSGLATTLPSRDVDPCGQDPRPTLSLASPASATASAPHQRHPVVACASVRATPVPRRSGPASPGGSVMDRLALASCSTPNAKTCSSQRHHRRGGLGQHQRGAGDGRRGASATKFVAVMTETFSIERRKLMRAYGAKGHHSPRRRNAAAACVARAESAWRQHGWFLARQFASPPIPPHHRSTGTRRNPAAISLGASCPHFVTSWGTGGALTGVGGYSSSRGRSADHRCQSSPRQRCCRASVVAAQIRRLDPDFVPTSEPPDIADAVLSIDRCRGDRHRATDNRRGRASRHLRWCRSGRATRDRRTAGEGEVTGVLPTPASAISHRPVRGVNRKSSDGDWLATL